MTLPVIAPPYTEPIWWAGASEDIPILYEDEEAEEEDMGEANYHVETDEIFHNGLEDHLKAHRPDMRAFSNMNLYYKKDGPPHPKTGSLPYVSPDGMAVKPYQPLPRLVPSYTIGVDGPAPLLVAEILSRRSGQQRDLAEKLVVYAKLGVREYLLIDVTGMHFRDRLLLKRLQPNGTWLDDRDADGGVTSELGFRVVIEADKEIRLIDANTDWKYPRPREADQLAKSLKVAEAYGQAQAEDRSRAEAQARAEAKARQRAEQQAQTEAKARQRAEQQAQTETEVRRQAELQVKAEAEARRQAEDNLRKLQDELDRLRRQLGETKPS